MYSFPQDSFHPEIKFPADYPLTLNVQFFSTGEISPELKAYKAYINGTLHKFDASLRHLSLLLPAATNIFTKISLTKEINCNKISKCHGA